MSADARRYSVVAIILHWAIAIGILWQIALGWWMGDAIEQAATRAQAVAAYQVHKSVGLTILALSLLRLAWRLMNPPPALPARMKAWEKLASIATHWAFYGVMIAMPLTGWLYVSTGWNADVGRPLEVPTLYFGLFQVPHLFGLSHLPTPLRAAWSGLTMNMHSKLAWVAIGLLVLHVGAALKHQFIDRDEVLGRMVPGATPKSAGLPPGSNARSIGLIAGFLLILAFFAGASFAIKAQARPAPAPAPVTQTAAPPVEAQQSSATPTPQATSAEPSASAAVPSWAVNRATSSIRYSGTHAGNAFEGQFGAWRASIRFDPHDLAHSSARVTITMTSAHDGMPLHDQTLPQPEWFDTAAHPTATFQASQFRARGAGYEAAGVLTLKGRDIPVTLPFTLTIQGDHAIMDGQVIIRRDQADLGQSSDPSAEWVSNEIRVNVHVAAARAP